MENTAAPKIGKEELLSKLEEWGIKHRSFEHPEVMTVEAALPHMPEDLDGVFAKNLFLKDKKKKLYLCCAPHDANIKLNDLGKLISASGSLRFADESLLWDKLGLRQGAVTLFGLINDVNNDVSIVLDKKLTDGTYQNVYFHPMVNTATTGISFKDILLFLSKVNHNPLVLDL